MSKAMRQHANSALRRWDIPEIFLGTPRPRDDIADNVLLAGRKRVQSRKSLIPRLSHGCGCITQGNLIDLIWHIEVLGHADNTQHGSQRCESSIGSTCYLLFAGHVGLD